MTQKDYTPILKQAVDQLTASVAAEGMFHPHKEGAPLPSATVLQRIIELSRAILFPGYYGYSALNVNTVGYHIGVNTETLFGLLTDQITAGLCFADDVEAKQLVRIKEEATEMAAQLISRLPELRKMLATDVIAAYNGDPAAHDAGEVISCYPVIKALTCYRLAHELWVMGVPLIPRIITEMAHCETGIDIHPGAQIGQYFTIDHGTGVVIGATAIIGDHVKLYQGVTLGAKSFPLDADGNPIKDIPRHPILEDEVIVYSNATILGRITIGKGATIGGNIWVTEDVEAGERVVQRR